MTDWPADKVERRAVADLIPYARNSRTHSDAQVDQIAASIREWGWTVPVLCDEEGGIIAGHGRVLAAKKLGLADVPVMTAAGWSEAQKRAYVIADNKLTENGGWDNDILRVELAELQGLDFDLSLTGFDDDALANLLNDPTQGLTDPDAVPEAPAVPVAVPGDIWLLGKHRLRCGDSTSADDVAALCGDHPCDLVFTSPPYAQQRDYGAAKEHVSDWDSLMNGVFSILPVKAGAQVLVNLGLVHSENEWIPYWSDWIEWMRSAGWRRFAWYVWDQGSGLQGNWKGRLAPSHEFIFHFNGKSVAPNKHVPKKPENIKVKRGKGNGLRKKDGIVRDATSPLAYANTHKIADSVIRVNRHHGRVSKSGSHPAVFPVALVEEMLASYAKVGDLFYEPFCGAGTAIIACEKFGAECRGMELDPTYVDVAVKRWQEFTGSEATLESTGETFNALIEKREAA